MKFITVLENQDFLKNEELESQVSQTESGAVVGPLRATAHCILRLCTRRRSLPRTA